MVCQIFVRDLSGHSRCLKLNSNIVKGREILDLCCSFTSSALLLYTGTKVVPPEAVLSAGPDGLFPSCHVSCRLLGGKGGFGSLLRGAATRAGQKKTTNFDACRDMSGRRLRHVNAEKKLKDWRHEAKERNLEKVAQDYIKKLAKEKKKASTDGLVMEALRERSAETKDRVAEAVRLGMKKATALNQLQKKRVRGEDELHDGNEDAKKKKLELISFTGGLAGIAETGEDEEEGVDDMEEEDDKDEEEEEDEEEEDDEEEEGKQEGGAEDKEAEGVEHGESGNGIRFHSEGEEGPTCPSGLSSNSPASGSQKVETDARSPDMDSLLRVSPEVDHSGPLGCASSPPRLLSAAPGPGGSSPESSADKLTRAPCSPESDKDESSADKSGPASLDQHRHKPLNDSTAAWVAAPLSELGRDGSSQSDLRPAGSVPPLLKGSELDWSLVSAAADLEVLGSETLKRLLGEQGLKGGGTLQERAARLFLLKGTPLDRVDRKHLAKAPKGKQ